MQAIRVYGFGGPEVMRLEEIPDPKAGPGQVIVQVRAIGVNPVDTYIPAGTYAKLPPLPFTPGMDAAGVIETVGEGVLTVANGDRVYTVGTVSGGACAELALLDASRVHPLPEHVTFAQGAAISIPYGTARVPVLVPPSPRPAGRDGAGAWR